MSAIISKPRIERITARNFARHQKLLETIMRKEFPANERLTPEQIRLRVSMPPRADKENFVFILESKGAYSMVISPHMNGNGETLGLIEYCATLGEAKGKGLGRKLIEHLISLNVSENYVLETEAVPRIVEFPIHLDILKYYLEKDGSYVLNGRAKQKALEGIEKRNRFWERLEFRILESVGYCQPNLDSAKQEKYPGQLRVPLDLQILTSQSQLTREELVRIIRLLAINYEDVITPENHVLIATRSHTMGEFAQDSIIIPVSYSGLLKSEKVSKVALK